MNSTFTEYSAGQAVPSTLFQGLISPSWPLCEVVLGFGPFWRQDLGPNLFDSDTGVSVTMSHSLPTVPTAGSHS